MPAADVARQVPAVRIRRDRLGAVAEGGAHRPTAALRRGQPVAAQEVVDVAEGIAEQAGPVRRQPLPQPGLRLGDLVFSLRFVRHGVEVAADQAVGAWIGQAG